MICSLRSEFSPRRDTTRGKSTPAKEPSRALIPVQPTRRAQAFTMPARPSAPFLAQLIATAQQTPQTREKWRIEPQAAIAAYEAVSARG